MADDNATTHRCCAKCAQHLPIDQFRFSGGKLQSYCFPCERAYKREHYLKNRDHIKQKAREWVKANTERKAAADRAYYDKNKERLAAQNSEYQKKHRKHLNQKYREWRNRNIEKVRAAEQRYRDRNRAACNERINYWRVNNPEKVQRNRLARIAAQKGAGGRYSAEDIQRLYASQKGKCACCRKPLNGKYHQDHITPLSAGGDNTIHNIQLLCPSCNWRKGARDPVKFMQSRGFLL